jgi:hypothetical protein
MKLNPEAGKWEVSAAKFFDRFSDWSTRHPVWAIMLVSLIAVVVNCYPVVFCGKSFVAPAFEVPMLYQQYPTLPGMNRTAGVIAHGSDTGATLIWDVPLGFVESRSIWEHGEVPLWNRYSHAGDTLIGQAISLLGDPLQLIVIAGHSSALSYDIKFLLAKFLFCVGFGLLIRRLVGSVPLALIFAAMAAYCGAFYFVFNHPSFFVFSYAPWILLSAIEMLDLESPHYFRWGLAWLLVNFSCFNAGHVELGVVLIGGLNFAALAFGVATHCGIFAAVKVATRLAIGTVLFLAFTAPVWISFLVALPGSYTIHEEIRVVQFPFASLLGIFDDVFFRLPVNAAHFSAPAPGSSFLVLVGFIYSLMSWPILKRETFFWINNAAIALWGGIVFGWFPASILAAVPLLNRDGHTHTDFSYLLVIHLTIQCAYGFRCLAQEESFRRASAKLLWTGFIVCGLTLLYFYGFEHGDIPWGYYFTVAVAAISAALLFAFLKSRPPIPRWGLLAVVILAFVPHFRFAFYNFGNKYLLMVPGQRVRLDAPSPAIDSIKNDRALPFRVTGVELILSGDYGAVYGLENISSCAPLSSGEYVRLLRSTPGILGQADWVTVVTNVVASHPMLNLLNIKYLLTPPEVEVQEGLGFHLAHQSDLGVLENLEVWPRAFFTDAIVPLSTTEEFIHYLLAHGKEPFAGLTPEEIAKNAALPQLQNNRQPTLAPATNYKLLPNSTAFDVHASAAGVVCLTEGQGRDFIATANGERKTVLTVNRAFKGIYLDKPGDYHIQFTYRPRYWGLSRGLFLGASGVVILLTVVHVRRHKIKKAEMSQNSDIQIP